MKKILLTIAGALMIGMTSLHAQSDTTQRQQPVAQPPGQVNPESPQQSQYRSQDRIVIPADQVPSNLRQTLQGKQYKGWERVPLFQDKTSQEYYFEMPDANGTTTRLHRFDRKGKALTAGARPGNTDPVTMPKPNEQ
jgi:hypothetical protein